MAEKKVASKKLEATMDYDGSISIQDKKYSFKKGTPFLIDSKDHLDVVEAEQERRATLAKG